MAARSASVHVEPALLLDVDAELFGEPAPVADAFAAIEAFEPVVAAGLERGLRLHAYTRHMLGLFNGRPGARAYRRHLATEAVKPGAGIETLRAAVAHVTEASRRMEQAA